MKKINLQQGFTLIELAAVVTISVMAVTLAVPSLVVTVRNNTLTAVANEWVGALNLARSAAIERRIDVRLCPSSDGVSCATDTPWHGGWLVFADVDDDGSPAAAEVLHVRPALDSGYSLQVAGSFADWLEFKPSGAALGSGGAADTFRLCHGGDANFSRAIDVAMSGRVQLQPQAAVCP